jgi:hypothetical protein
MSMKLGKRPLASVQMGRESLEALNWVELLDPILIKYRNNGGRATLILNLFH